ncbi:MAG TPA: hypothetical protein VFZ72_18155 [Jiangellaceae bacterium]
MKKSLSAAVLAAALFVLAVPSVASAEGPPKDPFDANDATWGCEAEAGVPPEHCINLRSQGNTGVIKVFAPDDRWPQESISFDPKSDDRPCPHDPAATDGTWWSPFPGAWVCHHKP